MKRFTFLLAALFLFSTLLIAIESEPSAIVGYVAYDCVVSDNGGNNFVALPLDSGYETAFQLGAAYTGKVNGINNWMPASQSWDAAFFDGDSWVGENFALAVGNAYMINAAEEFTFYSVGDLLAPVQYTLIEGSTGNNNFIMIPLNRPDLQTASQLGNDIGLINSVSTWVATSQSWGAAFYDDEGWIGEDFAVEIAKPLMVNVTEPTVWPNN